MIELGAGDLQAVTSACVAMESVEQESETEVADLETVACVAMVELAEIDLGMGLVDLETVACMTVESTEIDFGTETANSAVISWIQEDLEAVA